MVLISEVYSEACQTSRLELFPNIVSGLKPQTFFAENSVLDIWQVLNAPLDISLLWKISNLFSHFLFRNQVFLKGNSISPLKFKTPVLSLHGLLITIYWTFFRTHRNYTKMYTVLSNQGVRGYPPSYNKMGLVAIFWTVSVGILNVRTLNISISIESWLLQELRSIWT